MALHFMAPAKIRLWHAIGRMDSLWVHNLYFSAITHVIIPAYTCSNVCYVCLQKYGFLNIHTWKWSYPEASTITGLILGLRPANERRRYFVITSLIDLFHNNFPLADSSLNSLN